MGNATMINFRSQGASTGMIVVVVELL